jgi:CRISPR-associated protein (TIGR02584 family)
MREVFVSVLGGSPAVVTETLWYLMYKEKREIDSVYVITTRKGAATGKVLIEKINDMVTEYGLGRVDFPEENILIIKGKDGNELEDIISAEDNEYAANFITNVIRGIKRDNPEAILHCSIAGGRKTMSSYMALALTLLGTKEDKLYHILVSSDVESRRDFFYPPSEEVQEFEDKIFLVDIKYPRLGEKYSGIIPDGMSFTEMVDEIQQTLESVRLVNPIVTIDEDYELGGKSEAIKKAVSELKKFAKSSIVNVLLLIGETGTGKEVFAKLFAKIRGKELISHNFAELRGSDINISRSELFGHIKGAFTGALKDKKGWIENAMGKILFLDELQDATVDVQVLLNRVIEQKRFSRVGEEGNGREIKDITFIFAMNKDPEGLIKEGRLKQDFYNRINHHIVRIPPLNERPEDIEVILPRLLNKIAMKDNGIPPDKIKEIKVSDEVVRELMIRDWTNINVRGIEKIAKNIYINIRDRYTGEDHFTRIITLKELKEIEDELPPRLEKPISVDKIAEITGIAHKGESIVDLLKGRYKGKFEKFLDEFEVRCYSELVGAGMKQKEIANLLGMRENTLSNRFKKLREKGYKI